MGIILVAIYVGVSITNNSYALFTDTLKGEKTIEVTVHNEWNFGFTGDEQTFIVPKNGYYYIELGGAQGGSNYSEIEYGGKGTITSGYIYLNKGETLYIYVGEKGKHGSNVDPAYNGGGGQGDGVLSNNLYATGGGATDIRLTNGDWDDISSLISRIMVAGAGSGSYGFYTKGVPGGALYGNNGLRTLTTYETYGHGATQTSGGSKGEVINTGLDWYGSTDGGFGYGGEGPLKYGGGGGGGYYGGGGAGISSANGSSGGSGSSYISGYAGVNSVEENTTITHTNQTLHYSGKYFIGGKMLEGQNEGHGYAKIGFIGEKPEKKTTKLNNVRYIKNCISHNSVYDYNNWLEIEAIKDGINIAKGKTVTGTTSEHTSYPYSRITDGDIDYENFASPSSSALNQCVTVDLEQEYNLDEIAVWNFFGDQRTYYNNTTSVSSDNQNFTEIITGNAMLETSNGHRINAYTDTYNGYVSDNLLLWYDGYANTGTKKDYTIATWKDLSDNDNDGTLTEGTWEYDSLLLDGDNNTVETNLDAKTTLPTDEDRTLEITFKINSVPYDENTNGYTGVFFGAINYGGMGITWIRNVSANSYSINGVTRANEIRQVNLLHQTYPTKIITLTYVNNPSNNKILFYLNGEKIGEDLSTTGSYPNEIGNIGINKAQVPGGIESGNYANINVYSARIYNKALTETEIKNNFSYDKEKFYFN